MNRKEWAERLGRVSVWSGEFGRLSVAEGQAYARTLEQLGVRSLWLPEGNRDVFVMGSLLLGATERLTFASSIASIYSRDETATLQGQKTLQLAFPGRFLLGLGVSHRPMVTRRGHEYGPPVPLMRAYLNALDNARPASADWDDSRILAALGPQMLRLSAERAIGANPYFVPVAHTKLARATLGPDALLAVEQAAVLTTDPTVGRTVARRYAKVYLAAENYTRNLVRLGWDAKELAGEASDALIDAVVVHGDAAAIGARIDAHLAAGADTVNLQLVPVEPTGFAIEDWKKVAPTVLR